MAVIIGLSHLGSDALYTSGCVTHRSMHRSTAGHNPYNLFILTIVYSKNLPTSYLRTIEHMAMFVVKSIHIQINSQVMDLSIHCSM